MKKLAATLLTLCAVPSLAAVKGSLADKIETAIAGGPNNPRDVIVRPVGKRFFVEGIVDRPKQREQALEICAALAGDSACANYVRLRAGQPEEASPMLRLVYRVYEIPDLKVSASNALAPEFFVEERLPEDAKLLGSYALLAEDSVDLAASPASLVETGRGLSVEIETLARSMAGSDKIAAKTRLKLTRRDQRGDPVHEISTRVVLGNLESVGIAAWTKLDGRKVSAIVVTLHVEKLRSPSEPSTGGLD
jgi:hypothetical protein